MPIPTSIGAPENRARAPRDLRTRSWLLPLLRRFHFYAGILIGPFIAVAALSGALYAAATPLENVVYHHELSATAQGPAQPLADQVDAANRYLGAGVPVAAVRPAPEPGTSTRVLYNDPSHPSGAQRAVFVDPVTLEIRGDLHSYGTSGALPMRTWIDELHRNLHLGEPGRIYSELAASWMAPTALAGLLLWALSRGKRRRAADTGRERPANAYSAARALHVRLGLTALIGALFLSATGITWSTYGGANVQSLREAMDWTTPMLGTSLDTGQGIHAGHSQHHAGGQQQVANGVDNQLFDQVLHTAQQVNIDTGQVEITPAPDAASAWTVQEIHRSYPTQVDAAAVDPQTLQVTDRVDFAGYGIMAKLARWGIDLHMGALFGLANQLVMFCFASSIFLLIMLGYRMWWLRRPLGTRTAGKAPRSDALRRAPWPASLGILALAVAAGAFLPLLGISLAGFLLIDLVVTASVRGAAVNSSGR